MKYLTDKQTEELKAAYFAGDCEEVKTRHYAFDGEEITEIDPHDSDTYYRVERDLIWKGKEYTLSISDDADIATEN